MIIKALLLYAVITGPVTYENSVYLPLINSPQPTCIGEFKDDVVITYSEGATYVKGTIIVPEDSYYVIVCRDAYKIDYPIIASEPSIGQLFWLIEKHLVLIGPFKAGEEITMR